MSNETDRSFQTWLRNQIDEERGRVSSELEVARKVLGRKLDQLGRKDDNEQRSTTNLSFSGSVLDLASTAQPEIAALFANFWENVTAGKNTRVTPAAYHCFLEYHTPKDLELKMGSDYIPTPFYSIIFSFNRPEFGRFSLLIKEKPKDSAEFHFLPQSRIPIHKQRTQELITGAIQITPLKVFDNYGVVNYAFGLQDNPIIAARLVSMFAQTVSDLIDQGGISLDEVPSMTGNFGDNMGMLVEEIKTT